MPRTSSSPPCPAPADPLFARARNFHVFAALAELIRELIIEDTNEGLETPPAPAAGPPTRDDTRADPPRPLAHPDETISSIARGHVPEHVFMRELVYVSNAKLHQLTLDLPGRSGRLREMEAEVKTPLGGFKVGKAKQESEPGLAEVVAALESSTRAPRWFTDPTVRPGNWVHFEAPLSYCKIRRAVVFLDVDEATAEHPSTGDIRLLLHGSYRHLVGAPLPES